MTKSAADVISEKGVGPIAEALKAEPTAVRMWKHRNRIPRSVWPELIEAFPDLTLEALKATEAA